MPNIVDQHLDALALLDMLPIGVLVHGPDTKILHANKKALVFLRMTPEQALGKATLNLQWHLVDAYRQALPAEQLPLNRVLATGRAIEGCLLGVTDSSSAHVTWLTVNATPKFNPGGEIEHIVVTFTESLYERADIPFKDIVDTAQDVILITEAHVLQEPGPKIVYANQAFSRLTGYAAEEVIGRSPRFLQGPDVDPAVRARIKDGLSLGQPVREVIYNYSKEGKGYWLDMHIVPLKNTQGEVAYFAAIERDVTAQKELEHELRHFAFHDALTRLPNRRLLLDRLKHSLALAKRSGSYIAVLFIDLNKFKLLNDTHGHDAGDLLLIEVARRLTNRVRESDVVARLGGDEFVILLDGLGTDTAQAQKHVRITVEKIQTALDDTYILGDIVHKGSASIGVELIGSHSEEHDHDQILKNADTAMYTVKQSRR